MTVPSARKTIYSRPLPVYDGGRVDQSPTHLEAYPRVVGHSPAVRRGVRRLAKILPANARRGGLWIQNGARCAF